MVTESDLAAATAALFRAATGVVCWRDALEPFARRLDSHHFSLWLRSTRRIVFVTEVASSLPPELTAEYAGQFGSIDPLAPLGAARPRGTVFTSDDLMPFDRLAKTAYYNEWMGRHDMRRFIASCCDLPDQNTFAAIAFQRAVGSEPFGEEERRVVGTLLPQLALALEIWSRFSEAEDRTAGLERMLDAIRAGMAIVDADARVRLHNRSFGEWLARAEGVRLEANGRIRASRAADEALLRATIRRAAVERCASAAAITRAAGRRPYRLSAVPIDDEPLSFPAGLRVAILRVCDPDAEERALAHRLCERYGLTPAECEVAMRLAGASNLPAVASQGERSPATARNLMKRAFAKTGTHRQAELVALVHTIASELALA
ncbi:MAG TPA: hypothetical protein VG755_07835 [Nannocystaceae bacterium]|nr:hypothetical protein [Nannocystaceae bacterium]